MHGERMDSTMWLARRALGIEPIWLYVTALAACVVTVFVVEAHGSAPLTGAAVALFAVVAAAIVHTVMCRDSWRVAAERIATLPRERQLAVLAHAAALAAWGTEQHRIRLFTLVTAGHVDGPGSPDDRELRRDLTAGVLHYASTVGVEDPARLACQLGRLDEPRPLFALGRLAEHTRRARVYAATPELLAEAIDAVDALDDDAAAIFDTLLSDSPDLSPVAASSASVLLSRSHALPA